MHNFILFLKKGYQISIGEKNKTIKVNLLQTDSRKLNFSNQLYFYTKALLQLLHIEIEGGETTATGTCKFSGTLPAVKSEARQIASA